MKKDNCPVLSTIFITLTSKRRKNPTFVAVKWHLLQFPLPKQSSWPSSFKFCGSLKHLGKVCLIFRDKTSFETLGQFRTTGHEGTVVFEMPNPLGFCSPFKLSSQQSACNTQTCQSGASSFVHCQSSQKTYKKMVKND